MVKIINGIIKKINSNKLFYTFILASEFTYLLVGSSQGKVDKKMSHHQKSSFRDRIAAVISKFAFQSRSNP